MGKKTKDTIRCCWKGGLGYDIYKLVNGFGRVIKYSTTVANNVVTVQYPSQMWEGKLTQGSPDGFGRYINIYNDESFIGYIKGAKEQTLTHRGLGIYFKQ